MLITFHCATCRSKLEIEAEYTASNIECPQCRAPLTVPKPKLGPGTTVGGFLIEKPLGRGGMGEVYLARQLCLDRLVALKILPSHLTLQQDYADRFINEMRMLANVTHPNIVTAYEAGDDSGVLYLAMSYVPGQSLEMRLQEHGPLSEQAAIEITQKLAEALAHVWNTHHLLHRDIKPSNILFDHKDVPKLVDFGLAKSLDDTLVSVTRSNEVLGTPNYMSPERIDGMPKVGVQADMYSLGATLYHMLTGRIPFMATTVMEILRKQATEKLAHPATLNPAVSAPCADLIAVMMAQDPSMRHPDWESLIADVERVGRGLPPERRTPPADRSTMQPTPYAEDAGHATRGRLATLYDRCRAEFRENAAPILAGAALAGLAILSAAWWFPRFNPPEAQSQPTPPPAQPAPPEPRADPGLKAELEAAEQYAAAHPENYEEALAGLQRVRRKLRGLPMETRAVDAIRRLAEQHEARRAAALAELKNKVAARMEQGRFDEALSLLNATPFPFSDKPAVARQDLLKRVRAAKAEAEKRMAEKAREEERSKEEARMRQQAAVAKRKAAERKQAALESVNHHLELAAAALIEGHPAQAGRAFAALHDDQNFPLVSNDVAQVQVFLEELAGMPRLLLASFEEDKGEEVDVEFSNGKTEELMIVSVFEDTVKAQRRFPKGYVQHNFTLADLSPRERWRRLGNGEGPAMSAMRGILAAQEGYWDKAVPHFAEVPNPLGHVLRRIATSNLLENTAQAALSELVRLAGVKVDPEQPDRTLQTLRNSEYSASRAARLHACATNFLARYADTEACKRYRPMVDYFAATPGTRQDDALPAFQVPAEPGDTGPAPGRKPDKADR